MPAAGTDHIRISVRLANANQVPKMQARSQAGFSPRPHRSGCLEAEPAARKPTAGARSKGLGRSGSNSLDIPTRWCQNS